MNGSTSTAEVLIEVLGSKCASSLHREDCAIPPFRLFSGDAADLHIGKHRHGRSVFIAVYHPKETERLDPSEVLETAEKVVSEVQSRSNSPLLFLISTDQEVVLRDEFTYTELPIFTIDDKMIEEARRVTGSTALSLAVRQKLRTQEIETLVISPYVGKEPASGSSFFGREHELRELVNSHRSFALIGARLTGKTSLLRETERQLKEKSADVLVLDGQSCSNVKGFEKLMCTGLDPKRTQMTIYRGVALEESMLKGALLYRVRRSSGVLTLIIDELGTVLSQMKDADWVHFGVLRELIARNKIRLIFSCFQEFFLKQQRDFSGPFINMATTMRLGMLKKQEVHEFFGPLLLLLGYQNEIDKIADLAWRNTGGHPYLLQELGLYMFQQLQTNPKSTPLELVRRAFSDDLLIVFRIPVEEIFSERVEPIVQIVFLEAVNSLRPPQEVRNRSFGFKDVDTILKGLGVWCPSRTVSRILDNLELRGLFVRAQSGSERFLVVSPVVYRVATAERSAETQIARLLEDLSTDANDWEIRPRQGSEGEQK